MPDKPKISLNLKDAQMEQDVKNAFLDAFEMPKDAEGNPEFTPEQFVKHQIKEYIKRVLNDYKRKQAIMNLSFSQVDEIE